MKRFMAKLMLADELCFLVFALLKALGTVKWSWVWVLSPLWILGGLIGVCFTISIFAIGVRGTLDDVED